MRLRNQLSPAIVGMDSCEKCWTVRELQTLRPDRSPGSTTLWDKLLNLFPPVLLRATKCFEILFFRANFPGQRWSAVLFPIPRFPDDPIFQITRSQALDWRLGRAVVK